MLRVAIEGMFESFPRSFSMFQKVLRNICESIYTTATGFENLQLHKEIFGRTDKDGCFNNIYFIFSRLHFFIFL